VQDIAAFWGFADADLGFFLISAEISLVVCENDAKVNSLLEKAPRCLKQIVTLRELQPATRQRAKARGVTIHTFEEVEKLGATKANPEVVSASPTEIPFFWKVLLETSSSR